MDNLSTPEIVLLVAVAYLAIVVLTRMMISHHEKISKRVRENFDTEQKRKKIMQARKGQNKGDQSKAA